MHSLIADFHPDHFSVPPVLIPIAFVTAAVAVAVSAIYFHFQRQKLWHETVRLSLEKGVPLPPSWTDNTRPFGPECDARWSRRSPFRDLRTGLILVAIGLAISFQMSDGPGINWHSGGAIPLYIGCAFLLSGAVGALFRRKP